MLIQKDLVGLDSGYPPVKVTYNTVTKDWILLKDFLVYDPRMDATLEVRSGFRFDLASVPRVLWIKTAPFELSIVAPLFHDALYRHGGKSGEFLTVQRILAGQVRREITYSRRDADKLFDHHMKEEEVGWWRRYPAYRAVRLFGKGSWRG